MINNVPKAVDEQSKQQKQLLREVRDIVAKSPEINPEPDTSYTVFPLCELVVVDFKTWIFIVDDKAQQQITFEQDVEVFLDTLGYKTISDENTTYSQGWLAGISRNFPVTAKLKRAEAAIYTKYFGDLLYVSLRVSYKEAVSWLRVLGFVLVSLIMSVLVYPSAPDTLAEIERYIEQDLLNVDAPNTSITGGIFPLAFSFGSSFLTWFVIFAASSFIKGKGILGWLKADWDELYRDDLATIGNMSELAIISTADAMDLAQVPISDDLSRSSFQHPQMPKRKPRF